MKAGQRGIGSGQIVGLLALVAAVGLAVAALITSRSTPAPTGQPQSSATSAPRSVQTVPAGDVEISVPFDPYIFPVNMVPGDRLEVLVACPSQATGVAFSNILVVQEPVSAGAGQQQLLVALPPDQASKLSLVVANRAAESLLRYALDPQSSASATPASFHC